MPTSLTNRKMSPELVARIEASVRGGRVADTTRLRPRLVAGLRVLGAVGVALAISGIALARAELRQALEADRAMLLERIERAAESIDDEDRTSLARARSWLESAARGPGDEVVAEKLRAPGQLATRLAEPLLYVRGPIASFATADGLRRSAAVSSADAFTLCLIEPPSSRAESALLGRARTADAGGRRLRGATAHVEGLHPLLAVQPLLTPEWRSRVVAAEDGPALGRLRRAFDHAPLEAARHAAQARLLLAVMDEADEPGHAAELDGERPHFARAVLVDLARDELLFRIRRRLDPTWLSVQARAEYARSIDACTLAVDVRAAVAGRGLTPP